MRLKASPKKLLSCELLLLLLSLLLLLLLLLITGENYRLALLFLIQSKCLYVLELTIGLESNPNNIMQCAKKKISELDQRNE